MDIREATMVPPPGTESHSHINVITFQDVRYDVSSGPVDITFREERGSYFTDVAFLLIRKQDHAAILHEEAQHWYVSLIAWKGAPPLRLICNKASSSKTRAALSDYPTPRSDMLVRLCLAQVMENRTVVRVCSDKRTHMEPQENHKERQHMHHGPQQNRTVVRVCSDKRNGPKQRRSIGLYPPLLRRISVLQPSDNCRSTQQYTLRFCPYHSSNSCMTFKRNSKNEPT